ncbi:hypothetical protein RYX36_025573 [Vicia faba]
MKNYRRSGDFLWLKVARKVSKRNCKTSIKVSIVVEE